MSEDGSEAYEASSSEGSESFLTQDTAVKNLSKQKDVYDIRPSKRKNSQHGSHHQGKSKRIKNYHLAYHDLYNESIENVVNLAADHQNDWYDGRIGAVHWTSKEKEAFFVTLDRKGQDDVRAISRAIGTKSEFEVKAFLLALRDGRDQEQKDGPISQIDHSDVPAACEIGSQCEQVLEDYADELTRRQSQTDFRIEQERHGEWSVLNSKTIKAFKDRSDDDDSVQDPLRNALELYDLTKMCELSKNLFMNSAIPENDWRTYTSEDDGPEIFATALLDFHNLIIGITRRVMSSALFLAESRRKAQDAMDDRQRAPVVKRRDVDAACELLGLKKFTPPNWVDIAQKHNVLVFKRVIKKFTKNEPMTYEEVRRNLRHEPENDSTTSNQASPESDDDPEIADIAIVHEGNHLVDASEDERAEIVDAIASREEEQRLYNLIGLTPEDGVHIKQEEVIPRRPHAMLEATGYDWRDKIKYRPDWQTGVPPEGLFSANKRRYARKNRPTQDSSGNASTLTTDVEYASPTGSNLGEAAASASDDESAGRELSNTS